MTRRISPIIKAKWLINQSITKAV